MSSLARMSVNNPVLVNLMMIAIIIGGCYAGATLVREMFPESSPDQVRIETFYPGATPAEVEKGISIRIEEQIQDVDGVEELRTGNSEGRSRVQAILYNDVDDIDQVVTDIKAAIDTIPRDEFPEDAEEPQVWKFEPQLPVINVSYFGDLDEETLKLMGERLRDDLLEIPGVTKVSLSGTRKDEISIEVKPGKLMEYGLSLPAISDAIAEANLDLPGGQIKTSGSNVALRTLGEEETARQIGEIIVRSDSSGRVIRLRDVATIHDTFEDTDVISRFDAKPAVTVTAYKTPTQDAIEISRKVQALVAGKKREPLEQTWGDRAKFALGFSSEVERVEVYRRAYNNPYLGEGTIKTSTNLATYIEGRLDLLSRNGFWGLVWVFVSLLLFLNWRVAFWVMSGLMISVLGTLVVMQLFGYTLNLLTMFGLIIVLGLLVDDAIVVGEHVFSKVESGLEPKLAAIQGTEEVTWPVVCAIATTIVAFMPLLYIEGRMGDFMGVLPVIVLCALAVSLLEALSILPSHLAEWLRPKSESGPSLASRFRGRARRFRDAQNSVMDRLMNWYDAMLRTCVQHRYVTMTAMVSMLIVCMGMVAGGQVPFVFFQKMDSETIVGSLEMPIGTPIESTGDRVATIEKAVVEIPELDSLYSLVGTNYSMDGSTASTMSHIGQVIVELKPTESRTRTSEQIIQELRSKTEDMPGVRRLRFASMQGGPAGSPIHVEINGDELEDLVLIADRIKEQLRSFDGVYDIQDDFNAGRRELQIELLDSARALGLTTRSLASQVRGAFFGLEARLLQRGREDVKLMVRYPEEYRKRVYDLESMRIATPSGTLVPFSEVARFTEGRGFATITRKDRKRNVTVTADVNEDRANSNDINRKLEAGFAEIEQAFPGVKLIHGGQQLERAKSFGSLGRYFVTALLLIYAILAGLFRSYIQPLLVMCAIPFGMIGVIVGHFFMDYPITLFSMIGFVALSGIVVNDSLILLTFYNRLREKGASSREAVLTAGRSRMRAIMLTSITTILGLAPLLTETSFQAKFLIPMGISIAAGVAFATVLTLIGIPALQMIFDDVTGLFRRPRHEPAQAAPAAAV